MTEGRVATAGVGDGRPPNWRLQLALILLAAIAVRAIFFVGFGLGDDLGYLDHVDRILAGHYPSLDPLNQYAYRPLLLLLFAGGVALFGHTELGIVAPVLLSSFATTALVFALVWHLIDRKAAWWCALLYACEPFDVVNSTTMTNDVILSCLVFASFGLFLLADQELAAVKSMRLFAASGAVMVAAFLVKISVVPALCALGLYSLVTLRRRPGVALGRHVIFYLTFAVGLAGVCFAYYLKKGDFLWQFRSEFAYYETYKPDWYLAGNIDYRSLMWEYPTSLFWRTGYGPYRYFDHSVLFWLFVPAAIWFTRKGSSVITFMIVSSIVIFAFFEFYPQYLAPRYLPLVRQDRYLEMLLPGSIVVVGTMFHSVSQSRPVLAKVALCLLLGHCANEAARRSHEYNDSQQDVRELARYAASTVVATHKPLAVDVPARNALQFYLKNVPLALELVTADRQSNLHDCYVAIGGARSSWWAQDMVFDVPQEHLPPNWILAYEVTGEKRPWRPSNLRVYYVADPPEESHAVFSPPSPNPTALVERGLSEARYPNGFEMPAIDTRVVTEIPHLDDGSPLPAAHLEWSGWLQAEDALYTFECNSDDGAWIFLNERLMLDNGGVHPARTVRRTVRLARGWYRFLMRYEDDGGNRFLQLNIRSNRAPGSLDQRGLFFHAADRH
jgi:4-amino-4-deoxy-L-arabinose transferase-like glycosyltransferase